MSETYEHTQALIEARAALGVFRRKLKKLVFISGGEGYDNMGRRELGLARDRLDEADHWLARASGSLNAGGKRAKKLGYDSWVVEYMRPDGWEKAGGGFKTPDEAEAAAVEQLPDNAKWRVVPEKRS